MTTQPEQILENNLVNQLMQLGYKKVEIKDEKDLLNNLKGQLEKHNRVRLTDHDFQQVLNHIAKGNIFKRAQTLRSRVPYINDKGEHKTLELINQIHWCQNQFQVTQQVTMEGTHKNRYDVTLLINGLPLVQIELKRRGLELKEAFNQINRYERHSYSSGYGLFQFVQLFVFSNGVDTKYFANNPVNRRDFKQTFYWTDVDNQLITQLNDFTQAFLEPCHISKMITKYIVLHETSKMLMVLRPYQFYATEAIVDRVKTTTKYGYIWHTTGSGKTLTSFKTAQILTNLKEVYKVVFVVDRKDLDYQTTVEFNSFSKGSIDGTGNTNVLVKQLAGDNKLIVTTIQKLNTAIAKKRFLGKLEGLKDKRIVFIFDECHRSQFGKTHHDIKNFFEACQMFGFTGTPIFEDNAGTNEYGKRTTAMLFDKCLHKYVITDAIKDENVLKFSIEYIRTFKQRDQIKDIDVEAIDEEEVMNAPQRMENVVDYIIANHNRKTHSRKFNAIFCVSSVDILIRYYQLFLNKKEKGEHNLKLATIFSYRPNEEDKDANRSEGFYDNWEEDELGLAAEPTALYKTAHSRDELEKFIGHYNRQFGTNYTSNDSKSFYQYYNDVAKRTKQKEVDLLLVVNMFLTGFDSKTLNTLYVDKNLKYHGLIQAYSRTNRIYGELKSHGNIVCFRNLKPATDQAITLFSNKDAIEVIIMQPYEDYVQQFNETLKNLFALAPTVDSVNELVREDDQLAFVQVFRALIRLRNILRAFTEFTFDDLGIDEQTFEDYKSKYLGVYDKSRQQKEKVSILNDIDFELELIHRDTVNVTYILDLLIQLKKSTQQEVTAIDQQVKRLISSEPQLRSKKELIEKFVEENLPDINDTDQIKDEFEVFWNEEKRIALHQLCQEENLQLNKLDSVIGTFLFTGKKPLRDDVIGMMNERPGLKERAQTAERITDKILSFIQTFIDGIEAQ